MGVGLVATWLISKGVVFDSAALEIAAVSLISGAYYALVRALEAKFPWVGVLLGVRKEPTYL
jgi:hypothetical protein